ncbi:DUF5050 domain-containing protein [Clostridium guangxiense]|uniref:DUF5050 domain-containing protein n=1 Tax=Clostridium guangxiense TaxID=1662055 RepID=UPI001E40836B|nr:DUF5050 domain-containing protein [Clostridium guangxiense]
MKTFIKGFIIAVAAFAGLLIFKPYSVYAASVVYNDYQEQYNVSPKKVWKINFNNNVNLLTAQSSIYVYDSSNNPFPVTITLDEHNNNSILVTPVKNYDLGKRYYMTIGSTITSLNTHKNLNCNVRMYFNIKTKLDPSDYGDGGSGSVSDLKGIVIIGTDRAYSVSYLLQHSDIANDVNGNSSKKVYYIPDAAGASNENVKNLFGDKFSTYTSMTALHNMNTSSNTYLSDNIVYTDAIGNNYAYVWNGSTYILLSSGVNVTVESPSTTGAVSLTVNSVNAVSGAAYYKVDGTNIKRKVGESTSVFVSIQPKIKILILSSNQTEMGYAYVDVSQKVTNTIFPVIIEDTSGGNTIGNSNNNGSAVLGEDGYTYYLNSDDNDTIYKTDASGQYNLQIGLDRAQYMNEQNGWIYYSNYSDNEKIYRMKTDGTRREKVCDDTAAYIVVYGDWIYYSNESDGGKLYKVGVSAGASTKDEIQPDPSTYTQDATGIHGLPINKISSSQTIPFDEAAYINVSGNWIYYVNNSDDHKIYKIDLDGNFRTKVNDEWSACPQVVDDEIYYCSKTGEIMKIGTDGNSSPVDLGEQVNESDTDASFHINVSGDWIYYSNKNDNKSLYKVKVDGSGEKYKLTDMAINYVITAGDKLYIVSNRKEYTLSIDTTGLDQPTPVTKTHPDNEVDVVNDQSVVVDYMDVNQSIEWIEDKYLPEKVMAVMMDDTQQQLTVSWDKVNKTFNNGVYTYTGSILGYDRTVKLYLIIPSEMINGTNDITIKNNPGANDVVKISKEAVYPSGLKNPNLLEVQAKSGDVIRIYGDSGKANLLGKGTVGKDGSVTISKLDLDTYGDAFYVTIQRAGKYESNVTKILQMKAPTIQDKLSDANKANFDARDNDSVHLGVTGSDFTIYGWNEAHWDSTEVSSQSGNLYEPSNGYNNMYILPSGSLLDMSSVSTTAIKVDGHNQNMNVDSSGYNGNVITVDNSVVLDSAKRALAGGYYSIYISRNYNLNDGKHDSDTFVTADPNGSRPVVSEEIATLGPATEEVTSEGIPSTPQITGPSKVNPIYSNNIMATHGDLITLKQPVASNEEVWFVPSSDTTLISNIRAWRAQDHVGDTSHDTMDHFYASINKSTDGTSKGILKVSGSVKQNNFSVDNIDPSNITTQTSLSDGQSYYVFVVNDVGASLESTKYITVDYTEPRVTLVNSPNSTNSYDATNTTDSKVYTITIHYDDTSSNYNYNGSPGTIYILPGIITSKMDLTSIQYSKFMSKSVNANGNVTVGASQFSTNDYTIFAVDAAGNISSEPQIIHVNNPGYNPGGVINH